jgi:hypothetical protein
MITVGIPCYARPDLLDRTLTAIRRQTHRDLELVVSDNASPGTEVAAVVDRHAREDRRVRPFRQPQNRGPLANFEFVLRQAQGELFMWAADDDDWEPWFVERCCARLAAEPGLAGVTTEARYLDPATKAPLPMFLEGRAFYDPYGGGSRVARLVHAVESGYGNLFYSVFRTEALRGYSPTAHPSLNELPLMLHASMAGELRVLPEVGFFKTVPSLATFRQAQWEMQASRTPDPAYPRGLADLGGHLRYHMQAIADLVAAIRLLPIEPAERQVVQEAAQRRIWGHFLRFVPFSPERVYSEAQTMAGLDTLRQLFAGG